MRYGSAQSDSVRAMELCQAACSSQRRCASPQQCANAFHRIGFSFLVFSLGHQSGLSPAMMYEAYARSHEPEATEAWHDGIKELRQFRSLHPGIDSPSQFFTSLPCELGGLIALPASSNLLSLLGLSISESISPHLSSHPSVSGQICSRLHLASSASQVSSPSPVPSLVSSLSPGSISARNRVGRCSSKRLPHGVALALALQHAHSDYL